MVVTGILLFELFMVSLSFGVICADTINDTETLLTNLSQGYNKNVRPIYNQSDAINVKIKLYVKSIQEFDEVNEKFSFVAAVSLTWNDYKLQWDTEQYGGIQTITVSYADVWVPELTLTSPSSRSSTVGKSSDRVRYQYYGEAEWLPANLIESTCSVSVRNYPFDVQSCETSFMSLGYKSYEVNLTAGMSTIAFDVYSPNALWDVIGSNVQTKVISNGGESEIIFTLKIRRKSSFVVINVILPILVLSLLNVLVFLLVPESGERIGYCITTLLAIAVYMTIVSDMLPQKSQPVPLISYKLMADMITSALIVLVTIINLRFHGIEDDCSVPYWLQSVYRGFTCTRTKVEPVKQSKRTSMAKKTLSINHNEKELAVEEKYEDGTGGKETGRRNKSENPVTWKKISSMVDWIALITFTSLSLINTLVYIGIAKSDSGD